MQVSKAIEIPAYHMVEQVNHSCEHIVYYVVTWDESGTYDKRMMATRRWREEQQKLPCALCCKDKGAPFVA